MHRKYLPTVIAENDPRHCRLPAAFLTLSIKISNMKKKEKIVIAAVAGILAGAIVGLIAFSLKNCGTGGKPCSDNKKDPEENEEKHTGR